MQSRIRSHAEQEITRERSERSGIAREGSREVRVWYGAVCSHAEQEIAREGSERSGSGPYGIQSRELSALRARDCSEVVSLGHMQSNGLLMCEQGIAHKGSV